VFYITGGQDGNKELIGNGSACYRAAFRPKKLKLQGIYKAASTMLADEKIQGRIKALRESVSDKAGMTQAEILKIAGHMARASLADFYDEAGALKLPSEWTEEMRHVAAGLKTHDLFLGSGDERAKIGEVREVKLIDKNQAVERWFKHFGLYEKDNKQKTDPVRDLLAAIDGRSAKLTINRKPVG